MPTGSNKPYNNTTLLVFGTGFVISGILLTVLPEKFTTSRMSSTGLIRIIGASSAVFFGVCTFFVAKELLKNGSNDSNNER